MSGARIHQPQAPAVGMWPRTREIRRTKRVHDAWIAPCFGAEGFSEERDGSD